MKQVILFIVAFTFLWPLSTQAAGISVSPAKLDFELAAGSSLSQNITVENLTAEPVIFRLYADEFGDELVIQPDDFRMEIGEKRKVKITTRPKKAGLKATNLSIVAQDLDRRKFNVLTGVKVPLTLKVSAGPIHPWLEVLKKMIIIVSPLAIVAIMVIVLIRRRKRKWYEKLGDSIDLLRHHKKWWKIW
jgi:hypothetical protein